MIKTKEELLSSLQGYMKEDTGDDALSFIEDITDTFNDLEVRAKDTTDWEKKYNENDAQWREKYKERFFSQEPVPEKEDINLVEQPKKLSFEDLFS